MMKLASKSHYYKTRRVSMARKKQQFKNLGTLPATGCEWQMLLAVESGAIILTCEGQEPLMISDGKLTTLVASMKGKTDVPTTEES